MQVTVQPGVTTFPLRPDFEHAIIALDGPLLVGDEPAAPRTAAGPGQIAALAPGRSEIDVEAREPTRLMVLGGVPFPEPVFMWWNFVARNADEVSTFYADWRDHGQRFGDVDSTLRPDPGAATPVGADPDVGSILSTPCPAADPPPGAGDLRVSTGRVLPLREGPPGPGPGLDRSDTPWGILFPPRTRRRPSCAAPRSAAPAAR